MQCGQVVRMRLLSQHGRLAPQLFEDVKMLSRSRGHRRVIDLHKHRKSSRRIPGDMGASTCSRGANPMHLSR